LSVHQSLVTFSAAPAFPILEVIQEKGTYWLRVLSFSLDFLR